MIPFADSLKKKAFLARENVKRFEAQLTSCTDPKQRETVTRLLEQALRELAEAKAVKGRQVSC
jgi:hypothetical protein